MGKLYLATMGGALAVASLASCGGNGQSPQTVTTVNPLTGKLQLAVGTANIFGTVRGLNVVATFRQPQGAQAPGDTDALVNTPTLTGPFAVPNLVGTPDAFGATIATGASAGEVGKGTIASTVQQNSGSSTIPASTFGVSGGVAGLGIEPFNYTTTGTSTNAFGAPATFVPYAVPAYDTAADPNAFVPWGGPPAFDPNKDGKGERDGTALSTSILGVSEGLDVFAGVIPVVGTYTLSTVVPTAATSTGVVSTTATLASAASLPAATAPVGTRDGAGGGSFAVVLPAGVTEAYLQIVDIGPPADATGAVPVSCNGSDAKPAYYTLHVTASGAAVLPPTDGPGAAGSTTPSICTAAQNTAFDSATTPGDQYTTQLIGFDYPAYAASYPNSSGNPAPTLVGAAGQADITISPVITVGDAGVLPASKVRRASARARSARG